MTITRKTTGFVPRTDVTFESIRDVVNSDTSGTGVIPATNATAEIIFNDPSVYGNFVNGDGQDNPNGDPQVPGVTEQDKREQLQGIQGENSLDVGDWRGYGGQEGDGIPEIYWNNVITVSEGECIPVGDLLDIFIENNVYPEINIVPNSNTIANNIDANKVNQYNLANTAQSAYHRHNNDTLYNSLLATKVGIDYPNGQCGTPEFTVKVTPKLKDYSIVINNNGTIPFPVFMGFATPTAMLGLSYLLSEVDIIFYTALQVEDLSFTSITYAVSDVSIAEIGSGIASGTTYNTVDGTLINSVDGTAWGSAIEVTGTFEGILAKLVNFILPIFQGVSAYISMILFADAIWDLFENPANIINAPYQYQNTIFGIYNFQDISTSTYKIGSGNKRIFTDHVENTLIQLEGTTHSYSLDDPNYGDPFSADNLIPLFPNRSVSTDKYLNFEFFPKCYQFNYNTPPPILEYFVELIPLRNCVLSTTKITKFSVTIAPDKYYAPLFSIQTSIVINNVNKLYHNTSITFRNARFCDYIYLADTVANGGWFGLFGVYSNYTIQSDGNEGLPATIITTYDGNDITLTGRDIYMQTLNVSFPTSPSPDIYNVYFMQESSPNIIYNPYFRVEKNDTVGSRLEDLRKYWAYSPNVEIRQGGCYKTGSSSGYLVQAIPNVILSNNSEFVYYTLTLEFTKSSGSISLNTTNACFNDRVYVWGAGYNKFAPHKRPTYHGGGIYGDETSIGIYYNYANSMIEFLNSGRYYIIIETLEQCYSKVLRFDFSADFIGCINTCKLQYLPRISADKSGRGATNILTRENQPAQSFRWMDGSLGVKHLYFIFEPDDSLIYTINLSCIEDAVDHIKLDWFFINGTHTTENIAYIDPFVITLSGLEPSYLVITLYLVSIYHEDLQINSLTINNSKLKYIYDPEGCLIDADVDLSNNWLSSYDFFGNNSYSLGGIIVNLPWNIRVIKSRLNSLIVDNNLNIMDDISYIPSIISSFSANNTYLTGDLSNRISIPSISLDNTHVSNYSIGQPSYTDLNVPPNIVWKNSNINVESLNKLVYDLNFSTIENGYLDIAGDNPEISDTTALEHISNLVDIKGWTVLYNATEQIDWTYEGVMTVGYYFDSGANLNDYGWYYSENYNFGSLEPLLESEWLYDGSLAWSDNDKIIYFYLAGYYEPSRLEVGSSVYVNIDGSNYELIVDVGGTAYIETDINPFPAVGETCDIKLKYNVVYPPIITLIGDNPDTYQMVWGENYTESGVTAFDEIDGDITSQIIVVNTVDSYVPGEYTVTYNVQNSSGINAQEVVRTVIVQDIIYDIETILTVGHYHDIAYPNTIVAGIYGYITPDYNPATVTPGVLTPPIGGIEGLYYYQGNSLLLISSLLRNQMIGSQNCLLKSNNPLYPYIELINEGSYWYYSFGSYNPFPETGLDSPISLKLL